MELTAVDTVATIDLSRGTLSLGHKRRQFFGRWVKIMLEEAEESLLLTFLFIP